MEWKCATSFFFARKKFENAKILQNYFSSKAAMGIL
jgi:hypothetical protein